MDNALKFKTSVAEYANVAVEDITDDMKLRDDLGLSSLDFMTFLGQVEDEFDIELDLDEAVKVQTIGEALEMVKELEEAS